MNEEFPIKSLIAGVPDALADFADSGCKLDFVYCGRKYHVEYRGGNMHIDLIPSDQPEMKEVTP